MQPFFAEKFGNPHSSDHSFGWDSMRAVEGATKRIAALIGADPDEIVFTSGATESNNLALLGLGRRAVAGDRRRILLSAIEHKCVLAVGDYLERQLGYTVEQIPVDSEGCVIIEALDEALDDDVLAVSIMAVNNEIGTIQNIQRISKAIEKTGALFHCDAAQAPTAMDVREVAQRVDLLSLSSHKMYGPMGVGIVYIRRELQGKVEPLLFGGGQQNGLRSGTVPVPLCVGMAAAADLFNSDDATTNRVLTKKRRDRFIDELISTPWQIAVNGPIGQNRHPGNANIHFVGFAAHDVLNALQPRLAASTGSACTSGTPEPSHVLRAIGLSRVDAEESIRFSMGYGTSDQDIGDAVQLICETLERLAHAGLRRLT